MKFCEKLNHFIMEIDCTAKEICQSAGISAATLSRYRTGERTPESDTEIFGQLVAALSTISAAHGGALSAEEIRAELEACSDVATVNREQLRINFATLTDAMDISISQISKYVSYDDSTIFRIRSGSRQPSDPVKFAAGVAECAAAECETQIEQLAEVLGCEAQKLSDFPARFSQIESWLLSGRARPQKSVSDFLKKLNEFDLNEYIKAIHFDEMKVPTVPFQFAKAKNYFGLPAMMASEIDFLKATVLSKSVESVIMYSDMPMEQMAKDPEFPKKWMYGMALMLKKGLRLYMIHNVDRPFSEMMLGLESYIPMYMTGQISPYYLKGVQNNSFLHLLKVSGAAALSGQAIAGYHEEGKYYLTQKKDEIAYYRKEARRLLGNAAPLMEIYDESRSSALNKFLTADITVKGNRRAVLSAPPLYTMEPTLLREITRNLPPEEQQAILDFADRQRTWALAILENDCIEEDVPNFTRESFAQAKPMLLLSGMFFQSDVFYTYETYQKHLEQTKAFAKAHKNYTLKQTSEHPFDNLQILWHEGKWAMVSKGKSPAIHFVIHHARMCAAIENFFPPIVEA